MHLAFRLSRFGPADTVMHARPEINGRAEAARTPDKGGIVLELPIVVETTPWLSVGFGVLLILASLVIARGVFASLDTDEVGRPILALLVALFTFGLGISLAVQNLNWQFRLEEKGIILHAPFDYMRPGGEIGWSEITSVYVSQDGIRGPSYKLHIRGKPATEIIVANMDRMPAQLGILLQKLVSERAPQAAGSREIGGELANARRHPGFLAQGYSVRDGRGEFLR